jgi:hypothetical protein
MRNLAISAEASFQKAALRWTKNDLPISLPWRSVLWRTIVPSLWVIGCAYWMWVLSLDTAGRSLVLYALLFIGMPLVLAVSAGWWVQQFLHRRHMGTLVINDDYLEWQFEMGSNVDLLTDCGAFELVGKRDHDARIEWDVAASWDRAGNGLPHWIKRWVNSDRTLYARDLGLDRNDLEGLCKLLNQLRNEARAHA